MAFDGHHADSGNRGGNFDHAEPSVMERAIGLGMRVNSLGLDGESSCDVVVGDRHLLWSRSGVGVESDGFLELDSERSKLLVRVTQNRTGSASQMLTESK